MTFVRRQILHLAAGALALPTASRFASAQPASGVRPEADIAAVARDMYVFTFPLYSFYRILSRGFFSTPNSQRMQINQFEHQRDLVDHTYRGTGTPNNDTLYSTAFLNLSRGPLFVEVPEIRDRYYSLAFLDAYLNNFAYVGTRTTGSIAGKFLIAGPGWKGSAPRGTPIISSPTNAVLLFGRILVVNLDDLPRVHQLQDSLTLYRAPQTEAPLPFNGPTIAPDEPWNYFAVVNHALTENPPGRQDAAMIARMSAIDVGPGQLFDPAKFSQADQNALLAGIEDAKRLISTKDVSGKVVNGWLIFGAGIGNYGTDYLLHALMATNGPTALEPEEAMYMRYVGEPLDGGRSYRLRFESGNFPPANGFWSLSMYEVLPNGRMFFTENPIGRYSIGDRTPGLTRNADGSLDIYLQRDRPSGGRETNWLPTPAGPFKIVLRSFLPKQELLEHRYMPPPLMRLN